MNERELIISHMDTVIDTYHCGGHPVDALIEMRRDLAVHLYRLSAFVKQVHGEAGLSYIRRKYQAAREMVAAKGADAKLPQGTNEVRTEALASTLDNRTAEVWADAEREALRTKIDMAKQVLASMQQEIAYEAYEKRNAQHQTTGL